MIKLAARTIALGAVLALAGCSGMYFKQGKKLYETLKYDKAINYFERALEKNNIPDARVKLANSYRNVNNTVKAEANYAEVVNQPDVEPINYFNYGRMLMANKKYPEAKIWFNKYLSVVPGDKTAEVLLASCDSTNIFYRDSTRYSVQQLGLKGFENYFTSAIYKDGIVIAADKKTDVVDEANPWSGNTFLDMYYTEKTSSGWSEPKPLQGAVNKEFHDGPAIITKDKATMFFTRSNAKPARAGKLERDETRTNNLALYRAIADGDAWKDVVELPFVNKDYTFEHPALSADEKTLYFVSNMPGTIGGLDVWSVAITGDNTYGEPVNLGSTVNTSLDEMFPFFSSQDSLLYFSSQGHTNMGGLDVFSAKQDKGGKFGRAYNIGYPVNTTHDDFAYTMKDKENGYISSSRLGADKVFTWVRQKSERKPEQPLTFTLRGTVIDKTTGKPLEGATVEVIDANTNTKRTFTTGPDGKYKCELEPKTKYNLIASKETFSIATDDATTLPYNTSAELERNFLLDKGAPIVGNMFKIENIYYDFDKFNIRPDAAVELNKIVKIMKEYPNMVIELGSHTDSRATDSYNETLSANRAKSAVDYIVSRGIARNRLVAKGYGETQLTNECSNGVACSEEKHQLNRRTTFKIISY